MDILEKLLDHAEWQRFLAYKISGGHLSKTEQQTLTAFVESKAYLTAARHLNSGGLFSLPQMICVNKQFSEKKRTVFSFAEEENFIQKMLAFQLLDHDDLFCGNLYSFRRHTGVKKALGRLVPANKNRALYSYKLDISDYFNSVDPQLFLPMLERALPAEPRFCRLVREMLCEPRAVCGGETVTAKKGILAGSPLSGFFANLYLTELDRYFEQRNILYARYSDDIIVFAETQRQIDEYAQYIRSFLQSRALTLNPKKICATMPGEPWTFLGFCCVNGTVDISPASKQKLKKKMKRKANALLRWKRKKNADAERAVRAYIRYFNRKLYDNPVNHELTWCRWYFPIINTTASLSELDHYMQQCIRFVATGRQNKSRYNFTYAQMKALDYRPLVSSYYADRT